MAYIEEKYSIATIDMYKYLSIQKECSIENCSKGLVSEEDTNFLKLYNEKLRLINDRLCELERKNENELSEYERSLKRGLTDLLKRHFEIQYEDKSYDDLFKIGAELKETICEGALFPLNSIALKVIESIYSNELSKNYSGMAFVIKGDEKEWGKPVELIIYDREAKRIRKFVARERKIDIYEPFDIVRYQDGSMEKIEDRDDKTLSTSPCDLLDIYCEYARLAREKKIDVLRRMNGLLQYSNDSSKKETLKELLLHVTNAKDDEARASFKTLFSDNTELVSEMERFGEILETIISKLRNIYSEEELRILFEQNNKSIKPRDGYIYIRSILNQK